MANTHGYLQTNTQMKLKKQKRIKHLLAITAILLALVSFSLILTIQLKPQKEISQLPAPGIAFNAAAAEKIFVMKFLSLTPQGQAALTAYQWATNPEGSAISLLPEPIRDAIPILRGANPLEILQGKALEEAQGKVLAKIYTDIPSAQSIAQYAEYATQVFEIKNEDDAKAFAETIDYDQETGITKIKTKDGKDFLQIPKNSKMQADEKDKSILTITSGEVEDQEFKFKDQVSAYFKKDGVVKVKRDKIVEIIAVTSDQSEFILGNNKRLVVPGNTKIEYKDGDFTIYKGDKELQLYYGGSVIKSAENNLYISGQVIDGLNFKIGDLSVRGGCKDEDRIVCHGMAQILDKDVYWISEGSFISYKGMQASTFRNAFILDLAGNEHPGEAYISIDSSKKRIAASSKGILTLTFDKENDILKMEEGDFFGMQIENGNKVTIENRDSIGLNPLVDIVQGDSSGLLQIDNGGVTMQFLGGRANTWKEGVTGSVPITVTYRDEKGNYLIGTKERPGKLIVNNYNEIYALPLDQKEGLVAEMERKSFKYNWGDFTRKKFEKKYKIWLEDSKEGVFTNMLTPDPITPQMIKDISIKIEKMPDEFINGIKGITLYFDDDFEKEKPDDAGAWASGRTIAMKISDISSSEKYGEDTFYHEAAHCFHAAIDDNQKLSDDYGPIKELRKKLVSKLNGIEGLEYEKKYLYYSEYLGKFTLWTAKGDESSLEEEHKIMDEINAELKSKIPASFEDKWFNIVGTEKIYKDSMDKPDSGKEIDYRSLGVLSDHAEKNVKEDVATTVGYAYSNPRLFEKYLDPKNPEYNQKIVDKLKLLKEYNFFSAEMWDGLTNEMIK